MRNEIVITEANFETEVLDSTVPVLVDYWAAWCGPCRQLAPVIEPISAEQAGSLKVGKVNVDDEPRLAPPRRCTGHPFLVLYRDSRPVAGPSAFRPSMCSRRRSACRRLRLMPGGRASRMFA
jgi:thioredoxin 1